MGRPRKAPPLDPFTDLSKKTEILEREMTIQRAAIERLKEIGQLRLQPLRAPAHPSVAKPRASR
jgi:hypothetical protein